jgi:hypothetical protein
MAAVPRIVSESTLKLPQLDRRRQLRGYEFVLDQGNRLIRTQILAWFTLANREPEGCALRVHCKTHVGGSLMFREDANIKDLG